MANDKEVKIKLSTEADVSGAKQAEKSIQSLENEVKQLKQELRQSELGSTQFETLSKQLKNAENDLRTVTKTTNTAGGSFKTMLPHVQGVSFQLQDFAVQVSGGTSAMRAFSQQAPQLLGAFGPYGAIAGAVIALGPLLIQLFKGGEDGAKKAKEAAAEYAQKVADMADVFEQFSKERREATERGTQNDAKRLSDLGKELQGQQALLAVESERAKRAIAADGALELAQERLTLAQTERSLASASGETALRLAREREATIKRIAEIEAGIRQSQRNQDLRVSAAKVADAGEVLDTARGDEGFAIRAQNDAAVAMEQNTAALIKEREKREGVVKLLEDQIAAIRADIIKNQDAPGGARDNADRLKRIADLEKQLSDARVKSQTEVDLESQKPSLTKEFDAATEARIKAATAAAEADQAHAQKQREADQLVFNQQQEIRNEAGASAINKLNQADTNVADQERSGADAAKRLMDSIVSELGAAADSPANQARIAGISQSIADGLQRGEVDPIEKVLQQLIGQIQKDDGTRTQYVSKVREVMAAFSSVLSSALGELDEMKREVQSLRAQQGTPNH